MRLQAAPAPLFFRLLIGPSMTVLSSSCRTVARVGAVAAFAGMITLATTVSASAHVRVHADSTTAGSFSALTFRVPNESDTAGTVKLSVQLPQDPPFLSVSTKPVPGWTATTMQERLPKPVEYEGTTLTTAVRAVTWTAKKAAEIGPGQYQEFSLSVGPLPAAGTVLLPATQTYSDGHVVTWNQPTPASGQEPEHPAPELVVTAADTLSGAPGGPGAAHSSDGSPDGVARGLGAGGVVLGAGALAAAIAERRRNRTPAA